ncbi:MAG TPA: DUF4124 domain-containing protein [Xanthomonadaceae bacterium]|nr:DUF4124 domain-containing protein [Xanthomonadaceae bacterium]
MRALWVSPALMLALATAPNAMAQTVLYRCTDARGVVTLQNDTPCAKGSKQEKRVVEDVSAAPFPQPLPGPPALVAVPDQSPANTPPAAASTPAVAPASPTPAATGASAVLPLPEAKTPPAERLPPPPLYQCNTVQNDSYLSDTPEPKPRCVRMDTVGIDGTQQLGAGSACSMVYDQCQRVPDGAACDAWRQRVNEAQAAWTFARADSADELKAEYERIARIVAETTCNR